MKQIGLGVGVSFKRKTRLRLHSSDGEANPAIHLLLEWRTDIAAGMWIYTPPEVR